MGRRLASLRIPVAALHFDDGVTDLDRDPIFHWREIYGRSLEVG